MLRVLVLLALAAPYPAAAQTPDGWVLPDSALVRPLPDGLDSLLFRPDGPRAPEWDAPDVSASRPLRSPGPCDAALPMPTPFGDGRPVPMPEVESEGPAPVPMPNLCDGEAVAAAPPAAVLPPVRWFPLPDDGVRQFPPHALPPVAPRRDRE